MSQIQKQTTQEEETTPTRQTRRVVQRVTERRTQREKQIRIQRGEQQGIQKGTQERNTERNRLGHSRGKQPPELAQNDPREPQMRTLGGPRLESRRQFHEKAHRKSRNIDILRREREKQMRNVWPPLASGARTLRGFKVLGLPPSGAPPSRALKLWGPRGPPSGPPPSGGPPSGPPLSEPSFFVPPLSWPTFSGFGPTHTKKLYPAKPELGGGGQTPLTH